MTIMGQEKPPLDTLAHSGVLGMKWGHRKKADDEAIYAARNKIAKRQVQYAELSNKAYYAKKGTPARAAAEKKVKDYERSFNKDPARVISSRMTKGEKILTGLLAVPTLGLSVISAGVNSGISRRIEQKQDTGQYDKKK